MAAMVGQSLLVAAPVAAAQGQLSSSERSMLAHHGRWAIIGRMLTLISAFASMAILARVLTPISFAEFNILRTIITLFAIGAASGITQTALRILGRYNSERTGHANSPDSSRRTVVAGILRKAFVLQGVAAALGFATMLILGNALLNREIGIELMLLVTIAIVAFAASDVISELNRGLGGPSMANMIGGTKGSPVANLALITMLPVLWYLGIDDAASATLATAISVAIAAAAGLFFLIRQLVPSPTMLTQSVTPQPLDSNSSPQWGVTLSLTLSALLTFLGTQGDVFLVGCFAAESDEVAFVAARRLIFLLSIPLTMLNTLALGIIPRLLATGRRQILESTLRTGAALAGIPCLMIAAAMLIFPELTLRIFLGPGYGAGSILLQIMIPGQIVLVLSGSCGTLLTLAGHQRPLLLINLTMCLCLFSCGYLAASTFGAIGLSITVSVIIALHNLSTWALAIRLERVNTWCRFRGLRASALEFLAARQAS